MNIHSFELIMKKLAFLVIFSILMAWTVLGKNIDKKNHISSDFSILGGGIRYDRYVMELLAEQMMNMILFMG